MGFSIEGSLDSPTCVVLGAEVDEAMFLVGGNIGVFVLVKHLCTCNIVTLVLYALCKGGYGSQVP